MTDTPATSGIDHVGLTVANLDESLGFFTDCLGWKHVGGRPDYPSAFVSDGAAVLTLWQAQADAPVDFNRHANVGLHHLALKTASREMLDALFAKVSTYPGVGVEFSPEPSGTGPKVHCMINEPGGNRIEFTFDPR